jgi:hypothetical protein
MHSEKIKDYFTRKVQITWLHNFKRKFPNLFKLLSSHQHSFVHHSVCVNATFTLPIDTVFAVIS